MAMTPEGMADDIFEAMKAGYEGMELGKTETMQYLTVFTTGIIKHMSEKAEVLPGSFSNSGGNVTGKGEVK
jgi:hypothetical protein